MRRKRTALLTLLLLVGLVASPIGSSLPSLAQQRVEVLPVGALAQVANPAPADWALSGDTIARIRATVGGLTPIMRTELWDARLVEILRRMVDWSLVWDDVIVDGGSVAVRLIEIPRALLSAMS
jgi:hypothetical protein